MEITASMVKDLRETSGAGMMDCKKALTECNGNMDEAINWLREKGIAKSAKKESRIAAEGLANIFINDNYSRCDIIPKHFVNNNTSIINQNSNIKKLEV